MAARELRLFMEVNGKSQRDLAELVGSRGRASELLNEKRAISKGLALKIHDAWGVPLEDLLR